MIWSVASGDVWPLTRAEPSIKGIIIAAISFAVYLYSWFGYAGVINPIFWIVDIDKSRNWDAPRNLTRNVPVFDFTEVVNKYLLLAGWVEFNLPFFENLDGAFGKRFNIDEPLLFYKSILYSIGVSVCKCGQFTKNRWSVARVKAV